MIAFYKLRGSEPHNLEAILAAPVAFVLFVMNYAVTKGIWPVIGNAPLTPDLLQERFFSKKDPISGELTTYRAGTGEEFPATQEECDKLERCAVWDPEHVVDRLQDYYAGRPNDWVESLRV